jgi:AmmeMemoRadiSam system protein A
MGHATSDVPLSTDAQRFLLGLARTTIDERLGGRPPQIPSIDGLPCRRELEDPRGAFVTLKIGGVLRGCIGHVVAVAPLWQSVRDNALAAAFEDPRFPELVADELPKTTIEISALTPMRPAMPNEVQVGHHGILIERGRSRGLLLPQVATEYGWDRETFLDHTCRKAGLEPGCWRRDDTAINIFSAEIFGEEDFENSEL